MINHRLHRHRFDLLAVLLLLGLALLWFLPVLFPSISGQSLLPYDNLYSFEPWRSMQPGMVPHNNLLSDLVLQNAVWKQHILQTASEGHGLGKIPLWNPQIFTGIPFYAAGQSSASYPLSILFFILPLETAYGWFTAIQIALAGINMYLLGRVLGLRPLAAFFSGLAFMLSGFMVVSVVFTMFLAAVVWLPLLLAIIELIIRKQEEKGPQSFRPIPYIVVGALVVGVMILAGHPELIYYTLLVSGAYALVRLIVLWRAISFGRTVKLAGWLLAMVLLGIGLGAVQLLPLLELLPQNFREGSASLEQIRGWAWPSRHVLAMFLPNIFGNPSHHQWFDIWSGAWVPATQNALGEPVDTIFWGIKNYVEGGNYIGIVTWLLAAVALVRGIGWRRSQSSIPTLQSQFRLQILFFAALALISLLFAFGTPLYAILFYGLPGWSQLHSPFRWVFPLTVSLALLGGIGLELLFRNNPLPTSPKCGEKLLWDVPSDANAVAQSPPRAQRFWGGLGWDGNMDRSIISTLSFLAALAGLATLFLVLISYLLPDPFIDLARRVVDSVDLAQMAFADGRMFWSYTALSLVHFGVAAFLSGGVLWLWQRFRGGNVWPHPSPPTGRGPSGNIPNNASAPEHSPSQAKRFWGGLGWGKNKASPATWSLYLIPLLLLFDLYAAHGSFNPSSSAALSPRLPENRPAVVDFIDEREPNTHDWRFTTFNLPGEKTFNANVGMYYGWHDVRGYDSIIPRQYVDLMERVAPQENELLYNRIAPLYFGQTTQEGDEYASLDNPLLDLLGVKYALTMEYIPNAKWTEIFRHNGLAIYENAAVLGRALVVPTARIAAPTEQPLLETDPTEVLFIEEAPDDANALLPASPQVADVQISRYTANEVFVDLNLSDRSWLLLNDAYSLGWKAYVREFGGDESGETELKIYRANGAFRSVYLPQAGQWTVRFVYSPMSFKLGMYTTFLTLMTTLLLLVWWAWGRYYKPEATEGEVRTVAKNSLVPMALNLSNKLIDFAFAMLYVRLLGPEGTGKYYFVVALYGIFEIVSRYGLGTLLMRDVAADKNQSSRYLTNVLALRTGLWLIAMPVLALVTYFYWIADEFLPSMRSIGRDEIQAITLLAAAMLFANWSDALSNLFNAFEKMEYPAGLTSAIAVIKVALGALVLLLGWGFVGLAGVALIINIAQLIWLYGLVRRTLFQPEWQWDFALQKEMMRTSGPLMINHLLATVFWRIDVWILRPLVGSASIGLYSVGLKYLDGLNIIPSIFTMAIFPLMSRYAKASEGAENLLRSYKLSLHLLIMVSLPIAMMVTFIAEPLAWLVGGAQFINQPETVNLFGREFTYLGGSDRALQLIIWSIPIGFVNSVTQYVLIAVNQQRYLTKAFIIGVVFNTVGNLLVIPSFGYMGAAVVTILSEFSLLFPFYYSVSRNVGRVPWLRICLPPAISVAVMGAAIYGLMQIGLSVWVAVVLGWIVYTAALAVTGALRSDDMDVVWSALPIVGRRG